MVLLPVFGRKNRLIPDIPFALLNTKQGRNRKLADIICHTYSILSLMEKYRTTVIIVVILVVNVAIIVGGRYWQASKQQAYDEMRRHAERYSGATGETITNHDNRTDRWIAEMKEEPVEVILEKLTDAAEYIEPIFGMLYSEGISLFSDESRDHTVYSKDIHTILCNRRFRKAYEDLQKIDKKEAAELLVKNIKDNLSELRVMFQGHKDMVSQSRHRGNIASVEVIPDDNSYRYSSHPDYPPTQTGRRNAVFSYILLAALLEIQEVRPTIEDVVAFAKDEYKLFNNIEDNMETGAFKSTLLERSLYNPSLLLTATLCDPAWNAEKHKLLEAKLVNHEVVDWQARSTEYDMPGREGWVPVKPHEYMFDVRYYKGITDAEFNDFFGE
jgi:hypothetical protein